MQVLADGGGIYTQGITGSSLADGEHITGNVILDWFDLKHAIYTDIGSTFITATGTCCSATRPTGRPGTPTTRPALPATTRWTSPGTTWLVRVRPPPCPWCPGRPRPALGPSWPCRRLRRRPASLSAAFYNVGITDDSNTTIGNLDGAGSSFSAQALATDGAMPGATVTIGGVPFTWPNVASGDNDNGSPAARTRCRSASMTPRWHCRRARPCPASCCRTSARGWPPGARPCISSGSPSGDVPGQRSRYATRDWPGRRCGAPPLLAGSVRA